MSNSKYADEGSIAHELASMCLQEGTDAAAYIGRIIECEDYEHAKLSASGAKKWMICPGSFALESELMQDFTPRSYSMEVTEEMAEYVQAYVDAVRQRVEEYKLGGAVEVILEVEQRLPIGHLTGEPGATGTADAVIIAVQPEGTALLNVIDLKTGMGVEVFAENNEQLQIYALGALEKFGMVYEFVDVLHSICQPRIKKSMSEWACPVEALLSFGKQAHVAAVLAQSTKHIYLDGVVADALHLNPGEHCSKAFCKARATCPALAAYVEEGVGADFDVVKNEYNAKQVVDTVPLANDDALSVKMTAVDIIEDWCKAVRAEVERRLLHGTPVPGFKLVQGRKGSRAWSSADEAEALLKALKLKQDEMYERKLISPTTAAKVLKESPKKWERVEALITQSEGKPSVAPESDKRPALVLTPAVDEFEDLTGGEQ